MGYQFVQKCQHHETERIWKCSRSKETKEKWQLSDYQSEPTCVLQKENAIGNITGLADERGVQTINLNYSPESPQRDKKTWPSPPLVLGNSPSSRGRVPCTIYITCSHSKILTQNFKKQCTLILKYFRKKIYVFKLEKKRRHRWGNDKTIETKYKQQMTLNKRYGLHLLSNILHWNCL